MTNVHAKRFGYYLSEQTIELSETFKYLTLVCVCVCVLTIHIII